MSLFDPHGLYFRRKHSSHKGQVNTKKPTKIPDCDIADGVTIEKSMKIMKGLGYSLVRGKSVTVPIDKPRNTDFDNFEFHTRNKSIIPGDVNYIAVSDLWREAFQTILPNYEDLNESDIKSFHIYFSLYSVAFFGTLSDEAGETNVGDVNVLVSFGGVNSRNASLVTGGSKINNICQVYASCLTDKYYTINRDGMVMRTRDQAAHSPCLTLQTYSGPGAFRSFFVDPQSLEDNPMFTYMLIRHYSSDLTMVISDIVVQYGITISCFYKGIENFPIESE